MADIGYVHTLDPFAIEFGSGFGIRWYGLAYLAGFLAGYFIIRFMIKRGLSPLSLELVSDFVFMTGMGTIIGGRLGYCLLYSPDLLFRFTSSPPFWGLFAVNEGGMASHGGILGLIFGCYLFAKKHELSTLHLMDLTTLGGSLGIFFGRIANFINGELVGREAPAGYFFSVRFPQDILAWPAYEPERLTALSSALRYLNISSDRWADLIKNMNFNREAFTQVHQTLNDLVIAVQAGNQPVIETLAPLLTPRYPSQLYAGLLEGLLVFCVLFTLWARPRKPGFISGFFIITYCFMRIISESWRQPDLHIGFQLLHLTRGQWLSAAMFVLGLLLLSFALKAPGSKLGGWKQQSTPPELES